MAKSKFQQAQEDYPLAKNAYKYFTADDQEPTPTPTPTPFQDVTPSLGGNGFSDYGGGVDNGAAIREPAAENDYHGAFRCHHGHCAANGWANLTEWVNEPSIEELERAAQ